MLYTIEVLTVFLFCAYKQNMRIHFIGCLGSSMSGLMRLTSSFGVEVSGSDAFLSGHSESNVIGADVVVYSSAIKSDNVELAYAIKNGIKVVERAEFLGKLSREYARVIAVAGTHGKTTVTGMMQKAFDVERPTVHLGGKIDGESVKIAKRRLFITEACEYKRSFLHLNPTVAVVLNVEMDHPDYYRDLRDITSAYETFISLSSACVINGDCENCKKITPKNAVTFGIDEKHDFSIKNVVTSKSGTTFIARYRRRELGTVKLNVCGLHNALNGIAVIATGMTYGLPFNVLRDGLAKFNGVGRRFERIGSIGNSTVYSDYAHHPNEIRAVVNCAREMGYDDVTLVFEPHTFSRTATLFDEFSHSLSLANECLLVPIYPAREKIDKSVSSQSLCRAIIERGTKCVSFDTFYQLVNYVTATKNKSSAIVFCGAGHIDALCKYCVKFCGAKTI